MIEPKKTNWNPALLITLNLLAVLLLISWLWPPTRVWLDFIDFSVFNIFNNSLKTGKVWQTFWAISNWRLFDIIQFVVVFGIAFFWFFENNKKFAKQRIIDYFIFILLCFFITFTFKIVLWLLDYQRLSPTKIIDGAFRLSKTITCYLSNC